MAKYLDENGLAEFAGKVKEKMAFIGDSSAGSGYDIDTFGSYSLDEVATPFTWIDGKTIYKKTVLTTNIVTSGSIDIGATIENVVKIEGYEVRVYSTYSDTIDMFWSNSTDFFKYWVRDNTVQYRLPEEVVSSISKAYFTIWYTKS